MNYLKGNQIIKESRHQFIYGQSDVERSYKLMNLQMSYPIFVDRIEPMAIYVDNFELPIIEAKVETDKVVIQRMATEYLNFAIATSIMRNLLENVDHSLLKKREGKFFEKINRMFINNSENKVSSLAELHDIILSMRQFYKNAYINYLETGKIDDGVFDLPIAFLPIDYFVRDLKQMLNSNTHFACIFDVRKEMPIISQQAINNLIASRINSDISVKVVCDEELWKCYYDMQGQFIEDIHDYETIYYNRRDYNCTRSRKFEDEN